MKTQNIIRLLTGLSLLLLFCPFFEMCSFKKVQEETVIIANSNPMTGNGEMETTHSAVKGNNNITLSGWDLATMPFEDNNGNFFNIFLCFTGCGLASVLMCGFALAKKLRAVSLLAWGSALLAFMPFLLTIILDWNLNSIDDIRFGYPLYIINSIAIIVSCKKAMRQNAI